MHAIKSQQETQRCPSAEHTAETAAWTDSPSHADVALVAAVLAPPAIVGLLVLIGVAVVVAVCIMFVSVFAVTTTLDIRWLRRSRRASNDLRRA